MSVGITEFQAVASHATSLWAALVGVAVVSVAGGLRQRVWRWPVRGRQTKTLKAELLGGKPPGRPRNRRFPDVLTPLVLAALLLAAGSASAAPLPPAAPVVVITQADADVLLSWPALHGVSRFTVWQCEEPYCTQPRAIIGLVGHSTIFRISDGVPPPGEVRTWFVTAQHGNVVSGRSNLVGAFTYGLVAGG